MTPHDEAAFALLHGLRAVVAAWYWQRSHTRVENPEALHWRARRDLEDEIFVGEDLPAGHTWLVPVEEEAAAQVLPPAEADARVAPSYAAVKHTFGMRHFRLLHVATGDTRHIETPAAWLLSRGWVVYHHRDDSREEWRVTRPGAWRLPRSDPPVSIALGREAWAAWEEYLLANEWEREPAPDGERFGTSLRSPSGKVYPLWAYTREREATPAIDVALSRGGFDSRAELARGDAAVQRVAPPKKAKASAAQRTSP